MALGNFITQNSYTNIHNIQYCKHSKMLCFGVKTYTDSNCEILINENYFQFNGNMVLAQAISTTLQTPPETPALGDYYLVPTGATGDWAALVGKLVRYVDSEWIECVETVFYAADIEKYYWKVGGVWQQNTRPFDSLKFDAYFSSTKISEVNSSNLLKQIYTYLKTLPEFSSCTDV